MIWREKYLFLSLCLLFVIGNLMAQIFLQQSGLDNQVVNAYSPGSVDAYQYVWRAELIVKDGDFVTAFADAWRLPGYPLFLSVFYHFTDKPLLAARYAQIVLSSLTILFSYLAMANIFRSELKAIFGASLIALWIPFYYFSPILFAESCSIFLFSVFFWALSRTHQASTTPIYALPALLALLVYFKPNHISMLLPLWAFLLVKFDKLWLRQLAAMTLIFTILLLPWSIFASVVNNRIIPLSTTVGINLYLGTGVSAGPGVLFPTPGTLPETAANELGLRDHDVVRRSQLDTQNMTTAEANAYYSKVAIDIWKSRPLKTALFAVSKVLHSFGFSLRDFRDVLMVVLFVASISFSVYMWVSNNRREWCVFLWVIFFVIALQSFLFWPEQRFKVVFFDLPAMVVVIFGVFQLFDPWFKGHFRSRAIVRTSRHP